MAITRSPTKWLQVDPLVSALTDVASVTTFAHPGHAAVQAKRYVRLLLIAHGAHQTVGKVDPQMHDVRGHIFDEQWGTLAHPNSAHIHVDRSARDAGQPRYRADAEAIFPKASHLLNLFIREEFDSWHNHSPGRCVHDHGRHDVPHCQRFPGAFRQIRFGDVPPFPLVCNRDGAGTGLR